MEILVEVFLQATVASAALHLSAALSRVAAAVLALAFAAAGSTLLGAVAVRDVVAVPVTVDAEVAVGGPMAVDLAPAAGRQHGHLADTKAPDRLAAAGVRVVALAAVAQAVVMDAAAVVAVAEEQADDAQARIDPRS